MTLRPIDLRLLDNPLEVRVEPGPRSWWFIGFVWVIGLGAQYLFLKEIGMFG